MYHVVELFHDRDYDPPSFDSQELATGHMVELASEAIRDGRQLHLVMEGPDHRVIQSVAVNIFPH